MGNKRKNTRRGDGDSGCLVILLILVLAFFFLKALDVEFKSVKSRMAVIEQKLGIEPPAEKPDDAGPGQEGK